MEVSTPPPARRAGSAEANRSRPGDSVTVTWTSGGEEQSADLVLDSDATTG